MNRGMEATKTSPAALNGGPKMISCAVYTRKSTDENLQGDFTTLDNQAEYCRAFVKSREPEGWRVHPEVYSDAGYTGSNIDRPGIKKLIADARQGKFQVVVCYKYDRLTRSTKDFLHLLDIFEAHGIHFVSVTQPIDTTSPVGRLMRSILMEFAQFEREVIAERTRDKMGAMAKKGKWTGGPLPLGFKSDPEKKQVLIDPEEAKAVRFIFDTYLREQSLCATAKFLNAKGCRTKAWTTKGGRKVGGRRFFKTNLQYLLRTIRYIGKVRYRGELYQAEHPPLVNEATFQRVQDLLSHNNVRKNSLNTDKHDFLLKGLVRCGSCGASMIPSFSYSKKTKFFYYRCSTVNRLDKTACGMIAMRARALEDFVIEQLKRLAGDQGLIADIIKEALAEAQDELPAKRQERSLLAADLGKVDGEANNWMDILGSEGPASPRRAMILERMDGLGRRREELRGKLLALENELVELEKRQLDAQAYWRNLVSFVEVLDKLDPKRKKEFIRLLVTEVVLDRPGGVVKLGLLAFQGFEWPIDQFSAHFETSTKWLRD